MVFFETYLLSSYNTQIGTRLLIDCDCYKDYRDERLFIERVVNERKSYLACIIYDSLTRKRVGHRSIPIMLGSYIDYRIRGKAAVERSRAQWGAVILNGMLKIYTSFSTFDALSMHVRETNEQKSIEWFTYVDGEGMALCYSNKQVSWTYKNRSYNHMESREWIDLINRANPFVKTRNVQPSEYIDVFDRILEYPYDMNDLKNRQFLNGVTIINKYIEYDLAKRKRKKGAGCVKMATAFESGSLYTVLSKKNTYETDDWCKTYPQNYDNTLHEGRSNKTAHFLQNVTRASNEAFRNSKAVEFPTDAFDYFCILNTKELKAAGEQNVLADFVIMTEESDPMDAYAYLSTVSTGVGNHILINGFITDCRMDWTFETFLAMKRCLPQVTTKFYRPYIVLSTKASIPIKYSDEYDVYFSPAETTEYGVRYPEGSMLSLTAKALDVNGLRKTPPAKSTVAINNIKGSVAMVTSDLHRALMKQSLGATCYIEMDGTRREAIQNAAVLSYDNDTAHYEAAYADLADFVDAARPPAMADTDRSKAMYSLLQLYQTNELLVEYVKAPNKPYERYRNIESVPLLKDYLLTLFGEENYKCDDVWNLRLWAVFGNVHGACVEDGVVLDRKTAGLVPPICYNVCITVDFTFKTVKGPNSAVFVPVRENVDSASEETLVGCLITETEVYVKNSRHCNIVVVRIGNHYYYQLHFLPKKNNTYSDLKVRQIRDGKRVTVVITGVHYARVGVGTKVANAFGQKNICSMLADLSDCWGVTRDGRKVHAQIMYSDVSIVGRIASGQMYCMLDSPDVAIGPNKEIIAPVDLVIHALHPYTNIKVFDVKMDTLTNVNGFDSQALGTVGLALRNEKVLHKALQVIGLHGHEVRLLSSTELGTATPGPVGSDYTVTERTPVDSRMRPSSVRRIADTYPNKKRKLL